MASFWSILLKSEWLKYSRNFWRKKSDEYSDLSPSFLSLVDLDEELDDLVLLVDFLGSFMFNVDTKWIWISLKPSVTCVFQCIGALEHKHDVILTFDNISQKSDKRQFQKNSKSNNKNYVQFLFGIFFINFWWFYLHVTVCN